LASLKNVTKKLQKIQKNVTERF
jgi:hypothetical protein